MNDTTGINKFASLMQGRMQTVQGTSNKLLDFGEIMGDFSLKTTMFGIAIPKDGYFVCRSLTYGSLDEELTKTEEDGEHSHYEILKSGNHQHIIKVPKKMKKLEPGDKVLVAWVGNDPIVIDIIITEGW